MSYFKCARCHKKLKKGHYHNGLIYGPECIKKAGGSVKSSRVIKVSDSTSDDKQMKLI